VGLRIGLEAVVRKKIPSLFQESNSGRPAHSLVTMVYQNIFMKLEFGLSSFYYCSSLILKFDIEFLDILYNIFSRLLATGF